MSLGKRLLNNTVLLFGGDQLGNLLQMALLLYVARVFGKERIGVYNESLALVGGFALFADLGVVEYTIREVARRADPTRSVVARALVLRTGALVLMTGIALLMGPLILTSRTVETRNMLLLLGIYQMLVSIADVLLAELKGLQLMGRVASVGVFARFVTLVAGGGLIVWGASFTTIFAAFSIAGICYFALALTFSVRTLGLPPFGLIRRADVKAMLPLLVPFGTAILFNDGVSRQDSILLGRLKGLAALGIYWAGLKIATIFLGVSGFFQHAIYPMLSELHVTAPEKLEGVCRKVMRYLLIVAFPISAGMFAISGRLIDLILGSEYADSAICLQIMCWVVVVGLTHSVFSALLSATGRQHQKSIALAVNLAIGIGLNLLLIPFLGEVGASIARLAVEVAPLLMYGWLARRVLPGWNPWPDAIRPAIASVAMILVVRFLPSIPGPAILAIIPPIMAGALAYPVVLLAIGGFGRNDFETISAILPAPVRAKIPARFLSSGEVIP